MTDSMAFAEPTAQVPAVVIGDNIVATFRDEQVCTCAPGPEGQHEQRCGLELAGYLVPDAPVTHPTTVVMGDLPWSRWGRLGVCRSKVGRGRCGLRRKHDGDHATKASSEFGKGVIRWTDPGYYFQSPTKGTR